MESDEIRRRFLNFFAKRGHAIVPSASLIPANDPSVLFTTAGMQQFKPYYTGAQNALKEFGLKNTASVQKCVRTSDIDEVGDDTHLTFFEMLGNFSFGGYWKQEAIKYAYDFVTAEMGLKIDYVSVFAGEGNITADIKSEKIWQALDPQITVRKFGRADNFWGPTGVEGPCGPTTEIYIDGLEIWNIVFNEFYQKPDGALEALETRGIDTGLGLERLAKVSQKVPTVFDTDLFAPIMTKINKLAKTNNLKAKHIVADHIRAATFMIAEGVTPSNTEGGYILRRLIRRAVRYADVLGMPSGSLSDLAEIKREEAKFRETLQKGLREFAKGTEPFILFTTYGFPLELIKELAVEKGQKIDEEKFNLEMQKHQELSRAGAGQKFKGGLADHSDKVVQYHTATHLLHQALHDVLGEKVMQKGSNITSERLRFDFSHPQKLTEIEKQKIEEIVNQKIRENLSVQQITLPRAEAEKLGARMFFGEKYGEQVSVYFIGPDLAHAYSKEFCGGPHVKNTSELKGIFKITKEEAIAAGVRRIKAVLG